MISPNNSNLKRKKIPPIIKQTIKEMGNVMPNLSLRSSELKIVNTAKYNKKKLKLR